MTTLEEDLDLVGVATNRALEAVQLIAHESGVCVPCYIARIVEALEAIAEQYEHGEAEVKHPQLTREDIDQLTTLVFGPPKGTA